MQHICNLICNFYMEPPALLEQQRRCHSGSRYYRLDLLLDKSFLSDSSTVSDGATQLLSEMPCCTRILNLYLCIVKVP